MAEDLVAFLRARLDEDEQAACAAALQVAERAVAPAYAAEHVESGGKWSVHPWLFGGRVEASVGPGAARVEIATLANEHIARHDPARVLTEVAAKRALVDDYAEVAELDTEDAEPEFAYGRAAGLGIAVRLIAAAYADRPGYKAEWAT